MRSLHHGGIHMLVGARSVRSGFLQRMGGRLLASHSSGRARRQLSQAASEVRAVGARSSRRRLLDAGSGQGRGWHASRIRRLIGGSSECAAQLRLAAVIGWAGPCPQVEGTEWNEATWSSDFASCSDDSADIFET